MMNTTLGFLASVATDPINSATNQIQLIVYLSALPIMLIGPTSGDPATLVVAFPCSGIRQIGVSRLLGFIRHIVVPHSSAPYCGIAFRGIVAERQNAASRGIHSPDPR